MVNQTPEEKRLQHGSFAIHVARGVIRDQRTRRQVMIIVLVVAVVLMLLGTTLLRGALNPHERPGWFIFFWLLCAWLTITAILLALFDLLALTSAARKAQRKLREDVEQRSSVRPSNR